MFSNKSDVNQLLYILVLLKLQTAQDELIRVVL